MNYSLLVSAYFFLCFSCFVQAYDPTIPISKNEGLLLLKLDIEANSAIMTIKKVGRRESAIEIKLEANNGKWLLRPLAQGKYQIVDIKVPYFDLPYIKDTEKNPRWQINISPGKLNYAGEIRIEKERTKDFVNIRKFYRPAHDRIELQRDLASLLITYPLANGTGLRDDFANSHILNTETHHD